MKYDLSKSVDLKTIRINELLEAANAGDTSAIFMGYYISEGRFGLLGRHLHDSDLVEWVKRGTDLGDTLCTARCGLMLFIGRGFVKDQKAGRMLFEKVLPALAALADAGSPYAQSLLGLGYLQWITGKPHDQKAIHYFMLAAAQNDPTAEYHLGNISRRGFGMKPDHAIAASWFQKAADQKHIYAEVELADFYKNGVGVDKDLVKSVALYLKAARCGNALSQSRLGDIYRERGDLFRALKWYHRGAENNDAYSKYQAAEIYAKGIRAEDGRVVIQQNMAAAFGYYSSIASDRIVETVRPHIHKSATQKRNVMLVGTTRETEDDVRWIVFKDGTMSKAPEASRPARLQGRATAHLPK